MKKSAQVVLINKETGEILGVSRKDNHNNFGLPGGKKDPEDVNEEATAIRETKEETGLDIFNLVLVFAMHKDGYMGYTYLADYKGEINYTEPHVVKWVPLSTLIEGSFGQWNKLVGESLDGMGIKYLRALKSTQEWMFSVVSNEYGYEDGSYVFVSPMKYWKKHNEVPYPLTNKQSIDLDNICENGNIGLGWLDETSCEVSKNGNWLKEEKDIIDAMVGAGFIFIPYEDIE